MQLLYSFWKSWIWKENDPESYLKSPITTMLSPRSTEALYNTHHSLISQYPNSFFFFLAMLFRLWLLNSIVTVKISSIWAQVILSLIARFSAMDIMFLICLPLISASVHQSTAARSLFLCTGSILMSLMKSTQIFLRSLRHSSGNSTG